MGTRVLILFFCVKMDKNCSRVISIFNRKTGGMNNVEDSVGEDPGGGGHGIDSTAQRLNLEK